MRVLPAALFAFALPFAIAWGGVAAQAQTSVTATCKDGSTQTGASRRAACKGHGGVVPLKAASGAAAAPSGDAAGGTEAAPAASTAAGATASGEQPAPAAAAPASKPRAARRTATAIVARTPGNPTDVWVNSATKIYHCPGSRPYGKTKAGSFMTEAAAKAAGDRPSHNKACTGAANPTPANPPAAKE